MSRLQPLNFKKWIEEHRHLLKPPVGNQLVWQDRDFIVMVVGGPNSRTDFHIDESEEFFYQVEGDITLRVMEDGKPQDIPIREGEIFLLPPRVPHSPQRSAGTVGLVIERKRREGELDGFVWFCPQCNHKLYDEFLQVTNIVTQLPPIFERFYGNPEHCTCKQCGFRMTREPRKG
jgi:3-hydroxyanthranilate 3,4-dioxygenase